MPSAPNYSLLRHLGGTQVSLTWTLKVAWKTAWGFPFGRESRRVLAGSILVAESLQDRVPCKEKGCFGVWPLGCQDGADEPSRGLDDGALPLPQSLCEPNRLCISSLISSSMNGLSMRGDTSLVLGAGPGERVGTPITLPTCWPALMPG